MLINHKNHPLFFFLPYLSLRKMFRFQPLPHLQWILIVIAIFITSDLFQSSLCDVGTAARYSPPYLPTDCDGEEASQFPTSNLFGAAGDGVWDNGASCGRQYLVRCISATEVGTCVPDKTIQIKIVDYGGSLPSSPSAGGTTLVLSETAFAAIANPSATSITIEFQQV